MTRFVVHAALVAFTLAGTAFPQRARSTRPEAPVFVATRHLHELHTTPSNDGARVTGDLDGDGDLDLLMLEHPNVVQAPRGLQIWLNGGRGDFHFSSLLSFEGWSSHYSFQVARFVFLDDVTGDGVLDLVYERQGPGVAPPVVRVHPGLGDGGFGPVATLGLDLPIFTVATGDCDGDGDADVLVHDGNTTGLRRLTWWRLEGTAFVAGATFAVQAQGSSWRIVTPDFDGDGSADAVTTNSTLDALQFFRTVGGAPERDHVVALPAELYGQQRLHSGDMDGDGDADVLVTVFDYDDDVFYFQIVRNDAAAFMALPLQTVPQPPGDNYLIGNDGAVADWDGDGDTDYLSRTFAWMENDGAGTFALTARQVSGVSSYGSGILAIADLNGDGDLDALTDWSCFFGDGTLPVRSSIGDWVMNGHSWSIFEVLEDRERDGDLDLVGREYVQLNRGDGSFEGRLTPRPGIPNTFGYPGEVGWDDFDGDGFRDLVISSSFGTQFERMALFTGTEAGPYELSPILPSTVLMGTPEASVSADIDDDGDIDILTRDGYWANDGTGYFGVSLVGLYGGLPLVARDVDGDLDVDLLLGQGASLVLLVSNAGESFDPVTLGSYQAGHRHALLDVDQDGDLDVLALNPATDILSIHAQLPGGAFAAPVDLAAPDVDAPLGQIDVDGDGRLDLVAAQGGRMAAWLRGDGLAFPERREWMTQYPPIAFGDLDRDGDGDFVGWRVFENFRFDGPEDGVAVQYGLDAATSGTGGRHPVLGSGGPVRPGQQLRFVLGGGRGGASGVLLRGSARDDLVAGGIRQLVAAPEPVRWFVLGGTRGAAGEGSLELRTPVTAALVGLTFDYQAVLVDPDAGSGLSATNGLEIRYGDWPATR